MILLDFWARLIPIGGTKFEAKRPLGITLMAMAIEL